MEIASPGLDLSRTIESCVRVLSIGPSATSEVRDGVELYDEENLKALFAGGQALAGLAG